MFWFHIAQLSAFAVAAGLSWKTPRAALWVSLLAASYVISVLYVNYPHWGGFWPPSQLVGLLLDGAVLLAIREFHKEKWEFFGLGTIMGFMVTADIVQLSGSLTGYPPPLNQNDFGIILELLNYFALVLIGGVGLMDLVRVNDRDRMVSSGPDLLHRTMRYAHSRTDNPKTLRKW